MALELGVGERVDDVAQRREALQMQGGAGRCGEIQRRASGGLIRRALSRAWLIEIASLSVSPEAPVFEARSEPARSTRLILEVVRVALPFASVSCST